MSDKMNLPPWAHVMCQAVGASQGRSDPFRWTRDEAARYARAVITMVTGKDPCADPEFLDAGAGI